MKKQMNVESSMPKTPVLGRGGRWTKAKRQRCELRFVLVGFLDAPPVWILFGHDEEDIVSETKDEELFWGIDGPDQIIKIGEMIRFPRT